MMDGVVACWVGQGRSGGYLVDLVSLDGLGGRVRLSFATVDAARVWVQTVNGAPGLPREVQIVETNHNGNGHTNRAFVVRADESTIRHTNGHAKVDGTVPYAIAET